MPEGPPCSGIGPLRTVWVAEPEPDVADIPAHLTDYLDGLARQLIFQFVKFGGRDGRAERVPGHQLADPRPECLVRPPGALEEHDRLVVQVQGFPVPAKPGQGCRLAANGEGEVGVVSACFAVEPQRFVIGSA